MSSSMRGKKKLPEAEKKEIRQIARQVVSKAKRLKCIDVGFSTQAVTTSGTLFNLTAIPRSVTSSGAGKDDKSRVSAKVKIHRLEINVQFQAGTSSAFTTADLYNNCRLVIGKMSDSFTNLSGTLQTDALTTSPATDPKQPYETRFRWIKDYQGTVFARSPGSAITNNGVTQWRIRKVISGKHLGSVVFDGDLNSSDVKGCLYALMLSDSSALPNPTVNGYYRVWYSDE